MRFWLVFVTIVAVAFGATAAQAGEPATPATIAGATAAFDVVQAYEPKGVSSFAFIGPGGTYWLFAGNGPGGIETHSSADGLAWTKQSISGLPFGGSDISIVEYEPGRYRAYVAFLAPTDPSAGRPTPCSGLSLRTATSTDLRTWTAESGNGFADLGCGVPQVVKNPAGGYFMYWVSGERQGSHGSRLATSSDGHTFQTSGGLLIGTDLVDPSVIRLPDGSWLMAYATFYNPMKGGDPFRDVGLASSNDGISWSVAPKRVLDSTDRTRLDPTLLLLPDGRIRIYYSEYAVGLQEVMGATPTLRSAVITLRAAPKVAAAKKKTTTITCLKGTKTKKVTGTSPKCPAGWKQR